MSYRPIEIIDTWEDWGAQDNPPRYRRGAGRSAQSWSNFDGLEVKVAMIRAPNYDPSKKVSILGSMDAYRFVYPILRDEIVEFFYVIVMDSRHVVLGVNQVAKGGQDSVEVFPANVLRPVLAAGGLAFIVVHNHPSGDPEPSQNDKILTERLKMAAEIMGLPMLDHIIIGSGRYVSMADRGML